MPTFHSDALSVRHCLAILPVLFKTVASIQITEVDPKNWLFPGKCG
jgi:hypothetical protein